MKKVLKDKDEVTRQLALKLAKEWKVYIFHCTKCHHEWESADDEPRKCDWCGEPGKKIK